jgi:hypothetical protein
MYAVLVLDPGTLNHLGKKLPEGGRESSIVGANGEDLQTPKHPQTSSTIQKRSADRQRQREAKRALEYAEKNGTVKRQYITSTPTRADESATTDPIATAMLTEAQMKGLVALLGVLPSGSAQHAAVLQRMMLLSGVSDETDVNTIGCEASFFLTR